MNRQKLCMSSSEARQPPSSAALCSFTAGSLSSRTGSNPITQKLVTNRQAGSPQQRPPLLPAQPPEQQPQPGRARPWACSACSCARGPPQSPPLTPPWCPAAGRAHEIVSMQTIVGDCDFVPGRAAQDTSQMAAQAATPACVQCKCRCPHCRHVVAHWELRRVLTPNNARSQARTTCRQHAN